VVEDTRVEIGDIVAEFDRGKLRVGGLVVNADEDQWASLKTLPLSFFDKPQAAPDRG